MNVRCNIRFQVVELRFLITKRIMNSCNSCIYTIESIIVSYVYSAKFPGILLSNDFQDSFLKDKILCITLLGHLNSKQNVTAIIFNLFLIVDEKNHCLCQKY